ncbi:MAG: hypothetical protein ISP10_08175 [Aeromicrobium sp.]|nr:hypothetical protein [Aeromicrobium sp.]
MALRDIIGRIEADAGAEARAVLDAARERAEAIVAEAEAAAEHEATDLIAARERDALSEAQTLEAGARLEARDAALTTKRSLIDEVLADVERRLVSLPDDEYLRLIARGVAVQARGGDTVRVAEADAGRLRALPAAADEAAGRAHGLTLGSEPAPLEHGVMLYADRVSSEVSPRSLLDARRDHLTAMVAGLLFADPEKG